MKIYKQSTHTPACRLNVANLQSLILILEEDMGDKKRLEVSLKLKGSEIRVDSLDELLKHKDLPPKIYSMTLSVNTNWSSSKNRYICVVLSDDEPPYITVEGEDEAWVIGKCKQIENFLIDKKAKFGFRFGGKIFWSVLIFVLLVDIFNSSLIFNFVSSHLTFYSVRVDILTSTFALLSSVFLIYLLLLRSHSKRLYPYTKIILKEDSDKSKWDINTIINLCILIIGILCILVPIAIFILSLIIKPKSP